MKYGSRVVEKISSKDRLDKLEKSNEDVSKKNHYIKNGKKKKLSGYSMVG